MLRRYCTVLQCAPKWERRPGSVDVHFPASPALLAVQRCGTDTQQEQHRRLAGSQCACHLGWTRLAPMFQFVTGLEITVSFLPPLCLSGPQSYFHRHTCSATTVALLRHGPTSKGSLQLFIHFDTFPSARVRYRDTL